MFVLMPTPSSCLILFKKRFLNALQPLQVWASQPHAEQDLEHVFGTSLKWASAYKHLAAFREGDFSKLPPISCLPPSDMPGLWGGYSRDLQRIFLSTDCPPDLTPSVLIEEIGHFLDQELCDEETPGDEGAHFSALVLGSTPTESDLTLWQEEEFTGEVHFQNSPILVEAAAQTRTTTTAKTRPGTTVNNGSVTTSDIVYATKDSARLVQTTANQRVIGSKGNDTFVVNNQNVRIEDNAGGTDTIETSVSFDMSKFNFIERLTLSGSANINGTGNNAANLITGNLGKNILSGGTGIDTLIGGAGNDTYYVDDLTDVIIERASSGIDTIITGNKLVKEKFNVIFPNVEFCLLQSGPPPSPPTDGDDTLVGTAGKDTIDGKKGNDTIVGLEGNDSLLGSEGNDSILGGAGNDTILGGVGNDTLDGGVGSDSMVGGDGNDVYRVDSAADKAVESSTGGNADRIQSSISLTVVSNVEILELIGNEPIHATGNSSNNQLLGNAGNNSLIGHAGNDTLNGGAGQDTLNGGAGNDYYIIESESDRIFDASGNDTLETPFNNIDLTSKSDFLAIEGLVLTGSALVATGNSMNNRISSKDALASVKRKFFGGLGDDTLLGGVGGDLLYGQDDNDTLFGGTNTISGEIDEDASSDSLQGGFGNDYLNGGAGNDLLLGGRNGYAGYYDSDADSATNRDTLVGGEGDDTLDGGLGIDSMLGGLGDDLYYSESSSDVFFEAKNEGVDTVFSKLSLNLSNFGSIENAFLSGTANSNLTGTEINNLLQGNIGRNSLLGKGGDDTINGGDENDSLDGGDGFDLLNGGLGTDYLVGGLGNDTFIVSDPADRVIELSVADSGSDEVRSGVNFDPVSPWLVEYGFAPDLDDGSPSITKQNSFASLDRDKFQNLENFKLTGSAVRAIANALDNEITGNGGNNIILAQGGSDSIYGEAGNDSLFGESDGLYATTADLESLTPQPSPDFSALIKYLEDEITGGLLGVGVDYIDGGGGNDYIDGGALNDTMIGGAGNDTLVSDNSEDILIEDLDNGTDWVRSSVNVSELGANIENLHLLVQPPSPWQLENASGAAPQQPAQLAPAWLGSGNADNNAITLAYAKDDPITTEDESIVQFPEQTVQSTNGQRVSGTTKNLSWSLPGTPDNTVPLTHFIAQFRAAGSSQWITQKSDLGPTDTAYKFTTLTAGKSYDFRIQALGATILRGLEGNDTITGAEFRESLLGGTGDDYLDGGIGRDTLEGGFGNDTLVVDDVFDAMREFGVENGIAEGISPLGGRDMVISSVTLDLSDDIVDTGKFIEDLKAADGFAAVNLSGNRLNNSLIGNGFDNQLSGERGNDSLIGNNGNDWLLGNAGNDWLTGSTLPDIADSTQIDTLTGGSGADKFVIGFGEEPEMARYISSDDKDYAFIKDYNPSEGDTIDYGGARTKTGIVPAGLVADPGYTLSAVNYFYVNGPVRIDDLVAVIQTKI
jgi:Ca2+-binding RTX toxin-like protein